MSKKRAIYLSIVPGLGDIEESSIAEYPTHKLAASPRPISALVCKRSMLRLAFNFSRFLDERTRVRHVKKSLFNLWAITRSGTEHVASSLLARYSHNGVGKS
jgi:hypothetical protein